MTRGEGKVTLRLAVDWPGSRFVVAGKGNRQRKNGTTDEIQAT